MPEATARFARYPSLCGKVVLITGGGSGIGACLVERFVLQDARVAFLDIDAGPSEQLVEKLSRTEHVPLFVPCDVTDISLLRRAIAHAIERLGPVDVLINNAGSDNRHAWQETTPEYWDRSISVNLRHHFFCIQAVAPVMQQHRAGSIINVSSISWMIPSTGLPAYVAAKAGIVGLTRTMARELGPSNIRVNAVLPGAILTERQRRLWWTPEYEREILDGQSIKRTLGPDDVANVVLFLASDDSSAITNQSYIVDGGWV